MSAEHESVGGPDRRTFLQTGLAGVGGVLATEFVTAADLQPLELFDTGADKVPKKPFGKTGEKVSIMGLGGFSLADAPDQGRGVQDCPRSD